MNNQRRQELGEVNITLDEAIDQIESLIDDEQDSYDNLPEGLQASARGDKMQEAIDEMNNIISHIEEVKDHVSCIAKNKPYKRSRQE
jgi:methyl-accepting chemotaxis protein